MKLLRNHYKLASHYSMLFFVALAAILAGNPPADAGSASSTLGVTARVVSSCRISTTLPPPGNADSIVAGANVDGTAAASIAVVCARAAAPAITISTSGRTAGIAIAQAMSLIDSDVNNKTHKESVTIQILRGLNGEAMLWVLSVPAGLDSFQFTVMPRRLRTAWRRATRGVPWST
ncbi:MAG: hypothetical protein U1E51_12335 [Candidatus Binatia bacterium]|nr:hypothetical protein [Candidatus Binatia bacterium]